MEDLRTRILTLTLLMLAALGSKAAGREVSFDFSSSAAITAMGITPPSTGSGQNITGDIVKDGVTLSFTSGSTPTRIWNSSGSYSLRIYGGGSMTVSSQSDITAIALTTTKGTFTASPSGLSGNQWKGSTTKVTFTITATTFITGITVTTEGGDSPTTATVSSIAAFNALDDGTEATLYLADDADARVTWTHNTDTWLRDNSGALLLSGFTEGWGMAYNRHVAGYLSGTKTTVEGIPAMTANGKTTKAYLAIAEPVTEDDAVPTAITAAQLEDHKADWVTLKGLSVSGGKSYENGAEVPMANTFGLTDITMPEDGSTASFSGIVTAEGNSVQLSLVTNTTEARKGNPSYAYGTVYPAVYDVTTGIGTIEADKNSTLKVYTVTGVLIGSGKSAVDGLAKGVYIVNGRKVVIR